LSNVPLWSYQACLVCDTVQAVSISSDGNYIVARSTDDMIHFFSRDNSTPLWSYYVNNDVNSVAISSDGNYIVAGRAPSDGKVYLFNRSSSTPLWSYTTGDGVKSVAISSDDSYITAASDNGTIYFFSRDNSAPLWSYQVDGNADLISISSDGNYYITYLNTGNKIYLFGNVFGNAESSFTVTLVFSKPDGSPLANTMIYYGTSQWQETNALGTTDSDGKIPSTNPALAGQTLYFKSSDGRYTGSTSVSSSGGTVSASLTEVSAGFPVVWIIAVIVVVVVVIGAAIFIRLR